MFLFIFAPTWKNSTFDWIVLKQSVAYPNAKMLFIHPKGLLI